MSLAFPPAVLVDTPSEISVLKRAVTNAKYIALDTESNSLFAYREQVCLIQISVEGQDFLIDPLRLSVNIDLPFLPEVLADSSIEKILHAAEYDVMCLRRDFDIEINNLFDTMVATRILGWEKAGLANLLEQEFGISVNKRFQRANWGARPLSAEMRAYAQLDTHYLIEIRHLLHAQLEAGGHLAEALELFEEQTSAVWPNTPFDPNAFWHIKDVQLLSRRQKAVLHSIYVFREQAAQQMDVPPFKIMTDKTLYYIAQTQPRSTKKLRRVRGISDWVFNRYADDIVTAVRSGAEAGTPPPRPRRTQGPPSQSVLQRYDLLHNWRKERAARRGVSSEVIMPKDALWKLASKPPKTIDDIAQITLIGPWRRKTYGPELLQLLAHSDQG